MHHSQAYSGLDYGNKQRRFIVDVKGVVKSPESPIISQGVILESLKFIPSTSSLDEIHIHITKIEDGKVSFIIEGEKEEVIHEIAINTILKPDAIGRIIKQKITPASTTGPSTDARGIMERFVSEENIRKGPLKKAYLLIKNFFISIIQSFKFTERVWEAITNQSKKKLAWDLTLLTEICGAPTSDHMTMYEALNYILKMIDREKDPSIDAAVLKRLKRAEKRAKKIKNLRNQFSKWEFNRVVKSFSSDIKKIKEGERILIPVGYQEDDQLEEMLLEISKNKNGTHTIALISTSSRLRSYFDRNENIRNGEQSLRREIIEVKESDLLASIPSLIELQTAPHCLNAGNAAGWRKIFLHALKFHESKVEVGKPTEPYKSERSPGHLAETLGYIKSEHSNDQDARVFELSVRIHAFLDTCKTCEKGLKDQRFWKLAQTTALHLSKLIEEEKELIGNEKQQIDELSKLYVEIQSFLEMLDRTQPDQIDLSAVQVPNLSGPIRLERGKKAPLLFPVYGTVDASPDVGIPFTALDTENPNLSIINWGMRCRRLIDSDQDALATKEATLMVHMLPDPTHAMWTGLSEEDASKVLDALSTMGEAIARGSLEKDNRSLADISCIVALNYYGFALAKRIVKDEAQLHPFIYAAHHVGKDLQESRLSVQERQWLKKIYDTFDIPDLQPSKSNNRKNIDSTTRLVDLSQFTAIVLLIADTSQIVFKRESPEFVVNPNDSVGLVTSTIYGGTSVLLEVKSSLPLTVLAPKYAEAISTEISNRYLTEYCALGCIRDNCPNYARVPKEQHRIHPLYMAHNFISSFAPTLVNRGDLYRDEVTDLMYTQQTNESGYHIWHDVHKKCHGFNHADGFTESDHANQVRNTFILYLNRPHFFGIPDLRWHFETRVFCRNSFDHLLSQYDANKPFLFASLKALKREIGISIASGKTDTAAWLIKIIEQLAEHASSSENLTDSQKSEISELLKIEGADQLFYKMTRELLNKDDPHSTKQQALVLPIFLERYFKKFCEDPKNPCFSDRKTLEMILAGAGKIQMLNKEKESIDPEMVDRLQAILPWATANLKNVVSDSEQSVAINRILTLITPQIAAMGLEWDWSSYPLVSALTDEGLPIQFNLSTGKLMMGETLKRGLPNFVKQDPRVVQMFGNAVEDLWECLESTTASREDKSYGYKHPNHPNIRILVYYTTEIDADGRPKEIRNIVVERQAPNLEGRKVWHRHIPFDEQARFELGSTPATEPDIPSHVAAVLEGKSCWVDWNSRILAYDNGADQPSVIISLQPIQKGEDTQITIKDVYLVPEGQYLLQPTAKQVERFTSIEKSRTIQVTGEKETPSEVRYSRYTLVSSGHPLVYQLTPEGPLSTAYPGYRLAPYGKRPGVRDLSLGVKPLPDTFDAYHLLEKEGNQKILIPFHRHTSVYSDQGEKLSVTEPDFGSGYQKSSVYEYAVDPQTNRLTATTGDAYAYLAYIAFVNDDYDSARYYLEKAKTSAGYSKMYDKLHQWVQQSEDQSPNAIAFKLHYELFHEKVLKDRRAIAIKEGNRKELEAIAFSQTERQCRIADLYEKHLQNVTKTTSFDPSLDFSYEQRVQISTCIRELLAVRGNELVGRDEPTPFSSQIVPQQSFSKPDNQEFLGIKQSAMLIWAFHGNKRGEPTLGFEDPRWILYHFVDSCNHILNDDKESASYKSLIYKIRMASELPLEGLEAFEKEAIRQAQSYLLKLATGANTYEWVENMKEEGGVLAKGSKVPSLQGPFLFSSRLRRIEFAQEALKPENFGTMINRTPLQVQLKAREILERELDKYESERNEDLIKFADHIYSFAQYWRPSTNDVNPDKVFQKDLKAYALAQLYGSGGAQSIQSLNNLLNNVEPLPIEQPTQRKSLYTRQKKSKGGYIPKTFQDKYGVLIETDNKTKQETAVKSLESSIAARPDPVPPPLLLTTDSTYVVSENRRNKIESRFTKTTQEVPKVSEKVFDQVKSSPEPSYVRLSEENRADMRAAIGEKSSFATPRADAVKTKKDLEAELKETQKAEAELRRDLLQFIDRFDKPASILAMQRITGKAIKPTMDTLISIWLSGEIENDWQDNPLRAIGLNPISKELREELNKDVARYLEQNTKKKALERAISATDSYIDSCGDKESGEPHLAQLMHLSIFTERFFLPEDADYKDLLFIEYSQGIILRKQQVETVRAMLHDPNAVRQLQMGGGKSKVLLPLLAKRKANGKNLVMLMLPEELYETNCRDLDQTNRQLFRQEMQRFEFHRTSDRSAEAFDTIYESLLRTIEDRGYIMTTKRSVLAFRNSYIELLYKLESLPEGDQSEERAILISQIRSMSRIIHLFNRNTDVIADEVDACLDVRKEVNFSLGEVQTIDRIKVSVGAEVVRLILSAKPGEPLYELSVTLSENTQAALPPAKRAELLAIVAGQYYEKYRGSLHGIEKQSFIDYIMDRPGGAAVERVIEGLKDTDEGLYHQITAFKGVIARGFHTTLGRVGRVNYGRDPISEVWTIPYMASDTPRVGSEFDDDIERICFTYQDYVQNGVSFQQVYQTVTAFQNRAVAELRAMDRDSDVFRDLSDTKAGKAFEKFMRVVDPDNAMGSNVTLGTVSNPKVIQTLTNAINETPAGKLLFCETQVLGNLEQHSTQINSVSADLVEMIHHFSGFTGTPWNRHTYHDKIKAEKNVGTDGRTWALLLSRDIEITAFAFDAANPIDSLVESVDFVGNYQAVIDTGAYLRGTSNEEFVDRCLEVAARDRKDVEGGIYFDKAGQIVKKCSTKSNPLPLDTAPETNKMKTITLYDQAHTVGADIKQGKRAKAVVTVGENTFIRDLFQAVWRLRQIDQEQTVSFAVSEKIKECMLGGEDRELTTEDILKFCLMNEALRESEDNYRAEKEMVQGFARRAALNQVAGAIAAGAPDEAVIGLVRAVVSSDAKLFIKERPGEKAYDQYKRLKTQKPPEKLLKAMKKEAEAQCKAVAAATNQFVPDLAEEMSAQADVIASRPSLQQDLCPKTVDAALTGGGEVEQEAQAEVQQELELMVEQEVELTTHAQPEPEIPIVLSGEAGSGSVHPISEFCIESAVKRGKPDKLSQGYGPLVGDVVPEITHYKHVLTMRKLSPAVPYFDSNIHLGTVFERNLPEKADASVAPDMIFYTNRKPVKNVLISKKDDRWTMIVPTIHEAYGSCKKFVDTVENCQSTLVALTAGKPLVVFKTGEDRSEALPFDDEADLKQFYRLYIQAKLFNGEIDFDSDEEQEALQDWLEEVGASDFKKYFEDHILAAKPRRYAERYPDSSLFKVFMKACMAPAP